MSFKGHIGVPPMSSPSTSVVALSITQSHHREQPLFPHLQQQQRYTICNNEAEKCPSISGRHYLTLGEWFIKASDYPAAVTLKSVACG